MLIDLVMTTMIVNHKKQFRYSVFREDGAEMKKFFTLKLTSAFANSEDARIMNRKIRL